MSLPQRRSSVTPDTTLSSISTRQHPRTESSLSPFFVRLEDSITSKPPSIRFSTVSSFSSTPEPPHAPPQRPETPNEPVSWSAFARRQWSRLSHLASDDGDSVVSEPASYSNAAYVASDLWLVQKDVPNAEKEITERGRRRREKMTAMPQRSWTAEYRNDEMGSSRLISQFFSGRNTPTVGPTRQDRKDEFRNSNTGIQMGLYSRMEGRTADRYSRPLDRKYPREGRFDTWRDESRETRYFVNHSQPHTTHPQFQEQEFGSYVKRRFSRARKLRWWLRRVTHRVRDDWE